LNTKGLIKSSMVILLSILLVTSLAAVWGIHAASSSVTGTPEVSAPKIISANPPSIQSTYVTVYITPTDDAEVYAKDGATTNYGSTYRVATRTGTASTGEERSYLKFDLSPFAHVKSIENATLRLMCYTATGYSPGNSDVQIYGVGNNNWSEDTITWMTQPEDNNYNPVLENLQSTIILYPDWVGGEESTSVWHAEPNNTGTGNTPPYMGHYLENDIKTFVSDQISLGNTKISLMLKSVTEVYDSIWRGAYFMSKDGQSNPPDPPFTKDPPENWPTIVLTYTPADNGQVSAAILPDTKSGLQGTTQSFAVTVTNVGGVDNENYVVRATDNKNWNPTLSGSFNYDNTFENVRQGQVKSLTLNVTIPYPTAIGTQDNIQIYVYDKNNTLIWDNRSCILTVTDRITNTDSSMVSDVFPHKNIDNNYVRLESSPGSFYSFTSKTFNSDNGNVEIYLKYELNGVPANQLITSAKVGLFCWAARYDDIDAQIYGCENDDWRGTTTAWNENRPTNIDNFPLDTVDLYSWPNQPGNVGVENTWVYWEVGSFVQGQRLVDNVMTFLIKAAVENTSGQYFFDSESSKQSIYYPQLVLTFGDKQRIPSVSISPVAKIGDVGAHRTENFTVTVLNKGNVTDNFNLTDNADNTTNWTMTFNDNTVYNLPPGKSVNRTLTVTIPIDAIAGYVNNIKVTATAPDNSLVTDNENCSVSVQKGNSWVPAGYSPRVDNYGTAVTGAGNYIYVANSDSWGRRASFMRYDPTAGGSWTSLPTPMISDPFKNGTVLAWDNGNYIYALCGGSYADNSENSEARHYFFRYNIANNRWENLMMTGNTDNENIGPGEQGPGDAMVVVGNYVYAITGNRFVGENDNFWSYKILGTDNNKWTQLPWPAGWTSTDDGCSMVWTGGDNIYAFRGATSTIVKSFAVYSISGNSWTSLADAPSGLDDGGSLVWLGGDNIYALLGSNPSNEQPRDNCFFTYSRSGNSWAQLENLPQGIADPNGPRMGTVGGNIYVWRGACNPTSEYNPVLWVYSQQSIQLFTLNLVAGWNLVGFPLVIDTTTPINMFGSNLKTMKYWTAPGGPYHDANFSAAVDPKLGYWVQLKANENVTLSGVYPANVTLQLVAGWNLVHFPLTSASTTPIGLFGSNLKTMKYWTAPGGPYHDANFSAPVAPGVGYWVQLKANENVTVPM
jgi:hypothetical protein